jgi:hypothetical protein
MCVCVIYCCIHDVSKLIALSEILKHFRAILGMYVSSCVFVLHVVASMTCPLSEILKHFRAIHGTCMCLHGMYVCVCLMSSRMCPRLPCCYACMHACICICMLSIDCNNVSYASFSCHVLIAVHAYALDPLHVFTRVLLLSSKHAYIHIYIHAHCNCAGDSRWSNHIHPCIDCTDGYIHTVVAGLGTTRCCSAMRILLAMHVCMHECMLRTMQTWQGDVPSKLTKE